MPPRLSYFPLPFFRSTKNATSIVSNGALFVYPVRILSVLVHVFVFTRSLTSARAPPFGTRFCVLSHGQCCSFFCQQSTRLPGRSRQVTYYPVNSIARATTTFAVAAAEVTGGWSAAVVNIRNHPEGSPRARRGAASTAFDLCVNGDTRITAVRQKWQQSSCFLPLTAGSLNLFRPTFSIVSRVHEGLSGLSNIHRTVLPSVVSTTCEEEFPARCTRVPPRRKNRLSATGFFTAPAMGGVTVRAPGAAAGPHDSAAPDVAEQTQSSLPLSRISCTSDGKQTALRSLRSTTCLREVPDDLRPPHKSPKANHSENQQPQQQVRYHRQRLLLQQPAEQKRTLAGVSTVILSLHVRQSADTRVPEARQRLIINSREPSFSIAGCRRLRAGEQAHAPAEASAFCCAWEATKWATVERGQFSGTSERGLIAIDAAGLRAKNAGAPKRGEARENKRRQTAAAATAATAIAVEDLGEEGAVEAASAEQQSHAEAGATLPAQGATRRNKRELLLQPRLWRETLHALGVSVDSVQENLVKGGGKGGQKINKTSSCVVLVHRPSQTVVRCQQCRSQRGNRALARELLLSKLRQQRAAEELERQQIIHDNMQANIPERPCVYSLSHCSLYWSYYSEACSAGCPDNAAYNRERYASRQPTEEQKRAGRAEKLRRSEIKAQRRACVRTVTAADFD